MALVMMDPSRIGQNLKAIMKDLELSQVELAERAQLTPAAISQILGGERTPSLESVCRILGVIPVTFERLCR